MVGGVAEKIERPVAAFARHTGRGKLLFFGEHAAVYGYPAIGITLPMGIRISLEERGAGRLHGVPSAYRTKFLELLEATKAILRSPKIFDGLDILVESDLPSGRGLGSSASLCVALAAALSQAAEGGRAVSPETLWSYAHQAERLFHGKPSGIDTGLASGSGIAALYPRTDGLPERRKLATSPFWLVAGTVPRSLAAFDLIRSVSRSYAEGKVATVDAIRGLGRISELAIDVFSRSATTASLIDSLAPLADEAQALLSSLGLSTPELDEVLAAGKRAGAKVAKLSGAGGGGAYYFLAEDRDAAARIHAAVCESLRRSGGDPLTLFRPFFWTGSELVADAIQTSAT
jgi:mevalonate kinase